MMTPPRPRRIPDSPGLDAVPELTQLTGYMVLQAYRLFEREFDRRLAAVGISLGQWKILVALYTHDGLTQAELARRLELEQPTVSNTLKRMHRDGLIWRASNPTDRREMHLHLTESAISLVAPSVKIAVELDHAALVGLSPDEVQTLRELLQRFAENFHTDTTDS